jgi:hypothetical protein
MRDSEARLRRSLRDLDKERHLALKSGPKAMAAASFAIAAEQAARAARARTRQQRA